MPSTQRFASSRHSRVSWLPLERHFEVAFSSPDPKQYYHAIFNLFERFPDDDGAGVFWSALHGMEAVGGYEDLLLLSISGGILR